MAQQKLFNIVRKHKGNVSIFLRNLSEKNAVAQIRHWKRMARNSGGHVFFDMVEVPYELTPEGIALAQEKQRLKGMEERIDQRAAECITASHPLNEEGWCDECMMFPNGHKASELDVLLADAVAA